MLKDILLLEPSYKNKYPPLGLMKISYYHKNIKKDYVVFAKGRLPQTKKDKKFDRIYVSSLFTFEWEKTIDAIQYAKKLLKYPNDFKKNIKIGGILATLMPGEVKNATGIQPVEGLLNEKGKLGYHDDNIIDNITPDYSILDEIEYKYPYNDAYFAYMTRGCGMDCDFCAVKYLEPEYQDYISITEQINNIKNEFGEKRHLLLMDNNVLKSPRFNDIIDEIIDLGFEKGATQRNPETGKHRKRYVDFNQGLDANYLIAKKAKKLSEVAIRPARIAFDYIKDEKKYKQAVYNCAKYDIKYLSNYVLYNTEELKGKGNSNYKADKPQDLYKRLKITLDLKKEMNKKVESKEDSIKIFSFPMKYIPLKNKNRKFVGTNWNKKFLRAIQVMLNPTQGKGVSSEEYFEQAFGKNVNEFMKYLMMPEKILTKRGKFIENKSENIEQRNKRYNEWENNWEIWSEWERLFDKINQSKLLNIIEDNKLVEKKFFSIDDINLKKIYLYYLSNAKYLSLLNQISDKANSNLIYDYTFNQFNLFSKQIAKYIYEKQIPAKKIQGYMNIYGKNGIRLLLQCWIDNNFRDNSNFISRLTDIINLFEMQIINTNYLYFISLYMDCKCYSNKEIDLIKKYILQFDNKLIAKMLQLRYEEFVSSIKKVIPDVSLAKNEVKQEINNIISDVCDQISNF